MSDDREHLDPGRVPPWMMDSAKHDPTAMGWLAAGYLAGVEVGRKAGPCGHQEKFEVITTCVLAHGHVGSHSTAGPLIWDADQSEGESPRVLTADEIRPEPGWPAGHPV